MAIQTPNFRISALNLPTNQESNTPFGLSFEDFMQIVQLVEMGQVGETAATGGADENSDTAIMDALMGVSSSFKEEATSLSFGAPDDHRAFFSVDPFGGF